MNRHLKGFIASVVLVIVCAILAIASFTQGAWYGAIAPIVIGIIVLFVLALPCWKKHKENKETIEGKESDRIFLQNAIKSLSSSSERLANEFSEFEVKCEKMIDKIILCISTREVSKIHTNDKTKCSFALLSYFVLRSRLCKETRNQNFIGQLDRAMEEALPKSLLSNYEIQNIKEFVDERLGSFDEIMQTSTSKSEDLFAEMEQYISKEAHGIDSSDKTLFIPQIDEALETRIAISSTLEFVISSIDEEYEEVKKYQHIYAKPTY